MDLPCTVKILSGAHEGKTGELFDILGESMETVIVKVVLRGSHKGMAHVATLNAKDVKLSRTFKQMLNKGKRLLQPIHGADAISPNRAKKRARHRL